MPASFESSAAIDAINSVPLSNGAEFGSAKSATATGDLGGPNHPLTNFIAGSSALEYVAAPASWPEKLKRFKGGFDRATYFATTSVGVAVPSRISSQAARADQFRPNSAEPPP